MTSYNDDHLDGNVAAGELSNLVKSPRRVLLDLCGMNYLSVNLA